MATHHCPNCRAFSHHGPGTAHWALKCPHCGHVAKQVPHHTDLPPLPLPGSPLASEPELAELVATAPGPRHVGGGWYELPDGRRVHGKPAALDEGGDDES